MPDYVSPAWLNDAAPYINATNLQALTTSVERVWDSLGEGIVWVDDTANGDGITNDAGIINAAQATAANKVLQFGANTYAVGSNITPTASNVTWRGRGMWDTTLKVTAGATFLMTTPSTPVRRLTFEDMCFDGSELLTTMLNVSGRYFIDLTFRRCRFVGMGQGGRAIVPNYANGLTVENCLFDGEGTGWGAGIYGAFGASRVRIRNNYFMYVGRATNFWASSSNQAQDIVEDVEYLDNYHDGGWFLLKAAYANSGGTVTYTGTVLTDTAAAFSGLSYGASSGGQTVRIMPVLASGTITTTRENVQLTDAGATFTTAGVKRGDIVRTTNGTETRWNVVSDVESQTILRLEGWRDSDTYLLTEGPPSGSWTYTVYRTIIGEVASFTGTTITVAAWRDLEGTAVTPAAGTLYEVLTGKPASADTNPGDMRTCGPFFEGSRRVTVSRNIVKRSHNDQIAMQGSIGALITDNRMYDGRDMGMTLDSGTNNLSRRNLVSGNYAYHNGISGFSIGGEDHLVVDNYSVDNTWRLVTAGNGDNFRLPNANRCRFVDNVSVRANSNMALNLYGMALHGTGDSNVFIGNRQYGYVTAGIRIKDATQTNTRIIDNTGSVLDEGLAGWTRDHDDRYSFNFQALRASGSIAETMPKGMIISNTIAAMVAGQLYVHSIALPADVLVSSITFVTGSTAAAGVSNVWFAIYDNNSTANRLGYTADAGAVAWGANQTKTLTLATPFRTTYDGRYLLAIMINATTMPTMSGVNLSTALQGIVPRQSAYTGTSGQTTGPAPATLSTASFTAAAAGWYYAYVS